MVTFWTSCGCSSTTSCYNFSSSTGLDTINDYEISSTIGWGLISTFSSQFEITMTCGTSFAIDIVVLFRKFSATSNSCSNSLLFYSCSKSLISFIICAHEASDST